MIDTKLRKYIQKPIDKVAIKIHQKKISPNIITILALFIGLIAALLYALNYLVIIPILLLWLSGFLDVLDGSLARIANRKSNFGTIMDITFDRIVEGAMILAIVFRNPELSILAIILLIAILISISIFLSFGACVENDSEKTFKYQVGLAERTEGFIMFTLIMLFLNHQAVLMVIFITIIVITIFQRFYEAYCYFKV